MSDIEPANSASDVMDQFQSAITDMYVNRDATPGAEDAAEGSS